MEHHIDSALFQLLFVVVLDKLSEMIHSGAVLEITLQRIIRNQIDGVRLLIDLLLGFRGFYQVPVRVVGIYNPKYAIFLIKNRGGAVFGLKLS